MFSSSKKIIRSLFSSRTSGSKISGMNLLRNRFVLYFIFVISIFNIYTFLASNDMFSLALFSLVGFISSFFNKNMIVILSIAIVVTNIFKHGTQIRTSEGFEGEGSDEEKDKKVNETADETETVTENLADKANELDTTSTENGEKLGEMKAKYDELMALQKQIVSGVQSVYEPLQKAEGIVSGMKENMTNITKGTIKKK